MRHRRTELGCGGCLLRYAHTPDRFGWCYVAARQSNAHRATPACRPVGDGAIQAGLLFHLLAVGFGIALAGLEPIPNLQIFDAHYRVVLADGVEPVQSLADEGSAKAEIRKKSGVGT